VEPADANIHRSPSKRCGLTLRAAPSQMIAEVGLSLPQQYEMALKSGGLLSGTAVKLQRIWSSVWVTLSSRMCSGGKGEYEYCGGSDISL